MSYLISRDRSREFKRRFCKINNTIATPFYFWWCYKICNAIATPNNWYKYSSNLLINLLTILLCVFHVLTSSLSFHLYHSLTRLPVPFLRWICTSSSNALDAGSHFGFLLPSLLLSSHIYIIRILYLFNNQSFLKI